MSYFCHTIEEIEGIDVGRGKQLRDRGITTTEDLLRYSTLRLQRLLKDSKNFPLAQIPEYQAHAALLQVSGLTGQLAEIFYKSGYRTLTGLSAPHPEMLVEAVKEAVKKKQISKSIDLDMATSLQKRALMVAFTGKAYGAVESEGKPLAKAHVYIGLEEAFSNDEGKFWIPVVPYGSHTIVIKADGYKRFVRKISVSTGIMPTRKFSLIKGHDEQIVVNEAEGQRVKTFSADDQIVFHDVKLQDLPDETPLQLRYFYDNNDVRLIGVYRKRVGNQIQIPRVKVSKSLIDPKSKIGDIYNVKDGKLSKNPHSLADIRKKLFTNRLANKGIVLKIIPARKVNL